MITKVKLFATLRENRGKIVDVEKPEGCSAGEIINSLNIHKDDVAILLINGLSGTMDTPLKSGDYLSVFPPVGGG